MRRLVLACALTLAGCTVPLTGGRDAPPTHAPVPTPSASASQTASPSPGSELRFQGDSVQREIKIGHLDTGNYEVAWQASGSCSFSVSLSGANDDSSQSTGTSINGQASGETVVSTDPKQTYVLRITAAGQNGPCSWSVTVKRI